VSQIMRALKTLVIGMAVLIVAGLSVVVVTLILRAGDSGPATAPGTPAPPAEARIVLPAGAEIAESRLEGDRLLLRLRHADGAETMEIFEAATGRRLTRIAIDRAP
jgi:hypothetical protein